MPVSPDVDVEGLTVTHGDVAVVRDVSVDVRRGQPSALHGTNGAGDTSALGVVGGHHPSRRRGPQVGREVRFEHGVASWLRLVP